MCLDSSLVVVWKTLKDLSTKLSTTIMQWSTNFWFTDYLSVLPIVRICNCQWNICQYTKCHTIKCHTQRIVIYLKLWLMVSIFILLNEIQEKLHFIKGIEITNVIHVKSHFLIQGTWTHIDSVHNCQKDHKCNSCGKSFSQARNSHKFHIFYLLHHYVTHIFN